jgi:hypothetical protein
VFFLPAINAVSTRPPRWIASTLRIARRLANCDKGSSVANPPDRAAARYAREIGFKEEPPER